MTVLLLLLIARCPLLPPQQEHVARRNAWVKYTTSSWATMIVLSSLAGTKTPASWAMTSPRTRNSRCRRLPENSERGCLQAAEAITFGGSAEMPRLLDMGCALYEPRVDSTVSPKVVRLFCFCCCHS